MVRYADGNLDGFSNTVSFNVSDADCVGYSAVKRLELSSIWLGTSDCVSLGNSESDMLGN